MHMQRCSCSCNDEKAKRLQDPHNFETLSEDALTYGYDVVGLKVQGVQPHVMSMLLQGDNGVKTHALRAYLVHADGGPSQLCASPTRDRLSSPSPGDRGENLVNY